MHRRAFLATLAAPLPLAALQNSLAPGRLKIAAVDLLRLEGSYEAVRGPSGQHQVQPLHVYENMRPAPYREDPGDGRPVRRKTSALYLRISSDKGPQGLYGPIDKEAALVIDQQLRPFLIGKDPLAGETVWDQMYRWNRHARAGHLMMAISAVDNTLWDLRGRYFNAPVWRLLGGPTRSSVEVYGSTLWYSVEPQAAQAQAKQFAAEGYRNQKWFLAHGPSSGADGMAKNVELVRVLREAVGSSVELMFDAFMGWDLQYATRWAKQVEQFGPRWIEEAFAPDKTASFAQLRRTTSIPVASGEHLYGRWEVHDYLRAGALDVVQADPEWCGGVTELVKICALASAHDAQVILHGHSVHAAMHVVASQSPMTCPLVEYLILKMASYHVFEKQPPVPHKGLLPLPESPGFGIEFNPAAIEKQSMYRWDAVSS